MERGQRKYVVLYSLLVLLIGSLLFFSASHLLSFINFGEDGDFGSLFYKIAIYFWALYVTFAVAINVVYRIKEFFQKIGKKKEITLTNDEINAIGYYLNNVRVAISVRLITVEDWEELESMDREIKKITELKEKVNGLRERI